ncbi:MAG TPA: AI-2E family transporter [Cyclobacteriaceae bacterium]|nr:AI-2E family transporter [Cyclobacteriaceae bacterium]
MIFTEPTTSRIQQKNNLLTSMQYVLVGSLLLYFGSEVLIPIAYAALISFVLYPFCAWLERKGLGRMFSIGIAIGLLTILLMFVVAILVKQVTDFAGEWNNLQPRFAGALDSIREFLSTSFNISREQQDEWLRQLPEKFSGSLMSFIKGTISVSASSLIMGILIPIYVVLILYYRQLWKLVLCRLLPGESPEHVTRMLSLTIETYYNFIKGMGVVYLLVGILNSLGLLLLGIPHAFLFGFIASILTFIPYIGIMVGALLPITIAWITHDSLWYPAGVVAVFAFVQYLEANVIFPFAVSGRLKVNTMAVLLSIFIGGLLWGVSGMILFVPFVGIAKLIADSNSRWQTVSLALGTSVAPPEQRTLM